MAMLQPCCDAANRTWRTRKKTAEQVGAKFSELFNRRYKTVNAHKYVAGSSQFCPRLRDVHRSEIS